MKTMLELRLQPERLAEGVGDQIAERTQAIGRELVGALREARLSRTAWRSVLYDRLTTWAMADVALKTQLFRFIDVLPSLQSAEAVAAHLREYLLRPGLRLPPGARRVLALSAHSRPVAGALAWGARAATHEMARRFIAGADLPESLATFRRLRDHGLGFTADILGEAVISETEAREYQARYLCLIEALGAAAERWEPVPVLDRAPFGPVPRANVSLKLSALYARFDPADAEGTAEAVKARLRPILTVARGSGIFVNVDMEQYATKDLTQRIFREVLEEEPFRDWEDVGIVLQAYLRDAERDLDDLYAWVERRGAPVWVRLVKGAYWDYETVLAAQRHWPVPVWMQKWETDAQYERLTARLLRGWEAIRPAIGSHNARSVAHALAQAEALGLERGTVEFQVLYGMGDALAAALADRGQRVRVYVPYGELLPGMAYLVRRLLENTSNDPFLRHSVAEQLPVEALLRSPDRGAWGER
jgi:RHH-type transcriptional regulator, proline utilization regulon repressor / proline dehydrogenase / delta 1-pyrroline-5-carboxylate dehydrogenase